MSSHGEFRFVAETDKYDESVAFYRDGLGLPISDSWDLDDFRATLFAVSSGVIEVVSHPKWIAEPPVGA
jgi:catechol 2,3-dioxygenase-like lactoylglutathione lyase family enzyme